MIRSKISDKIPIILGIFIFLMFMVACAPAGYTNHVYGFWGGLWHGIIVPVTFIIKILGLFLNSIRDNWGNWDIDLWATNTTGTGYWSGYILGFLVNAYARQS